MSLHTTLHSKPTAGERNARLSRPQPVVLPVCTLRGAESTTARIVAPPPRRAVRARAHTHNERTLCARICRSGAPIEYSEYRKVLRAGAVAAEGDGLIGPWRASTCPIEYSEYRKVLTACGCGCGGRGRADRSVAGFYLPASKAGSIVHYSADDGGRLTHGYSQWPFERTRHAIVPGFPASHEHTHAHSLTCTHARTHTHTHTHTQCFADQFVRSAKLVSLLRFRRDPYSSRQFVYSNKSVTVFRRTSAGDDTFRSGVLRCVIGTRTGLCPATSAPGL
jgi:hypothetical protein